MGYTFLAHAHVHGHYELTAPDDLWGLIQSAWALVHGQFAHIYAPERNGRLTLCTPIRARSRPPGHPRHRRGAGRPNGHIREPLALHRPGRDRSGFDSVVCHRCGRLRVELLGALASRSRWGRGAGCRHCSWGVGTPRGSRRRGPRVGGSEHGSGLGVVGEPRAALGIPFEPGAILGVAPVLARLSWHGAARLWWRLLVPTFFVLIPPLLAERRQTLYVLFIQPTWPKYNSFTPFSHLAPALGHGFTAAVRYGRLSHCSRSQSPCSSAIGATTRPAHRVRGHGRGLVVNGIQIKPASDHLVR